jgi:hypothetical protein
MRVFQKQGPTTKSPRSASLFCIEKREIPRANTQTDRQTSRKQANKKRPLGKQTSNTCIHIPLLYYTQYYVLEWPSFFI